MAQMKLHEALSMVAKYDLNTKEEAFEFLGVMKVFYNVPTYHDILTHLEDTQKRMLNALETGENLTKEVIETLVQTVQYGRKELDKVKKALEVIK
jgi:hypothetical protein